MLTVWVACYRKYGWDDDEEDTFRILGVFTDPVKAQEYITEHSKTNQHGDHNIIQMLVDIPKEYGW